MKTRRILGLTSIVLVVIAIFSIAMFKTVRSAPRPTISPIGHGSLTDHPKLDTEVKTQSVVSNIVVKRDVPKVQGLDIGVYDGQGKTYDLSKQPIGFAHADLYTNKTSSNLFSFYFEDNNRVGVVAIDGYDYTGKKISLKIKLVANSKREGSTLAVSQRNGKTVMRLTFDTQKAVDDWRVKLANAGLGPYLYPQPILHKVSIEDATLSVR